MTHLSLQPYLHAEENEEDVQEVKEHCLSSRRDDVEDLQATSSPLALSSIPVVQSKCPSPVKTYRTSLADISNVPGIPDTVVCNEVTLSNCMYSKLVSLVLHNNKVYNKRQFMKEFN